MKKLLLTYITWLSFIMTTAVAVYNPNIEDGKYILYTILIITNISASNVSVSPTYFNFTATDNSTISEQFYFYTDSNESFNVVPSGVFPISLSQTSINQPKWIQFNLSIPPYFLPGNYFNTIQLFGLNTTLNITILTSVTENVKLRIPKNQSFNFSLGSVGYINLELCNDGNTPISDLNVTSNSSLLKPLYLNISFLPSICYIQPVFYDIPKTFTPSNYLVVLNFSNYGQTNITLNLKDEIPPEILSTSYDDKIKAGKTTNFVVSVRDNVNISKVWIVIENQTKFLNYESNSTYSIPISSKNVGTINFDFFVNDTSNNTVKETKRLLVEQLDGVTVYDFTFPQIKVGYEAYKKVFTSNETVDVKVKLSSLTISEGMNSTTPTNYTAYILVGSSKYDVVLNQTHELRSVSGDIFFAFTPSQKGQYKGELEFELEPWVSENKKSKIEFIAGDYFVQERFEKMIGTTYITCEPKDVGNYENSSYLCQYSLPIDTNLNDIGIFMSQAQLDAIDSNYQTKINYIKADYEMAVLERNILIVLITLIILIFSLIMFIQKRGIRIRIR